MKRDSAASGLCAALAVAIASAGCVAQIARSERPSLSDTAMPFTLESQRGKVALRGALAQGHAVIVFYRGHW